MVTVCVLATVVCCFAGRSHGSFPYSWAPKIFLSPRRSGVALLATHFLQFCVPPLRRLVAAGRHCAPSKRWILGTHCRRTLLPTIAEHHAAGQRACARVLLWTHSSVQKALQEPLFLPPRHEQAPRRRHHRRLSIPSPEHPKAGIAGVRPAHFEAANVQQLYRLPIPPPPSQRFPSPPNQV